jgi:hypothetical protein
MKVEGSGDLGTTAAKKKMMGLDCSLRSLYEVREWFSERQMGRDGSTLEADPTTHRQLSFDDPQV